MGFSVGLASFIVLIGFVAIFSTVCTAFFTSVQDISSVANEYISNQKDKINTQMQLTVDSVSATTSDITIKNIGSKTVFIQSSDGYNWNTIIMSYGSGSEWHSYTIESYTITEIKVIGTNATFNIATHDFINPGEQASISLTVPGGAPEITGADVVTLTFASHYGTTASSEGVIA
jgi:archaellum component FlaF (FlaF/FlaG flagellin family)